MKVTVIGAGNMGGAVIRGWINSGVVSRSNITAVAVSEKTLSGMRELGVYATDCVEEAVRGVDVVLIAVKPWLVGQIAEQIAGEIGQGTLVVSVAAGVSFEQLEPYFKPGTPLFQVLPNTAAVVAESMTFVARKNAEDRQMEAVMGLFRPLGRVIEMTGKQIPACTSLSCGIAFAMRYVRATMEGAIELGIPARMAQEIASQIVKGAGELLLQEGTHPEVEIDRVTTPGGLTIKGLNKMEEHGFTHAVIEGLKASK